MVVAPLTSIEGMLTLKWGNSLFVQNETSFQKDFPPFASTFSGPASPVDSTMNKTSISQLNLDLISLLCKTDELEWFHKRQ